MGWKVISLRRLSSFRCAASILLLLLLPPLLFLLWQKTPKQEKILGKSEASFHQATHDVKGSSAEANHKLATGINRNIADLIVWPEKVDAGIQDNHHNSSQEVVNDAGVYRKAANASRLLPQLLAVKPQDNENYRKLVNKKPGMISDQKKNWFEALKHELGKETNAKMERKPTYAVNWFRGWDDQDAKQIFGIWRKSGKEMCNRKMIGFDGKFLWMQDTVLDKFRFKSQRKGGENITDVLRQQEHLEYFTFEPGAFEIACKSLRSPDYKFLDNAPYSNMFRSISTSFIQNIDKYNEEKKDLYILVIRYEYVNLYHTMTDWYNAFLLMKFFNHTKENTNILIADTHPAGSLDSVWSTVFNSSVRVSELKERTFFRKLVWSIQGYKSIISPGEIRTPLPLHEEFREFFVRGYGLSDSTFQHKLNCGAVNVLFIWRRNYVAHPRNPSGGVARKITNEEQLVSELSKQLSSCIIRGYQLDNLPMKKQLALVSTTDVLIGMHGAGLTHAMFLPQTAGIIELEPYYPANSGIHFSNIATWRGLHHILWRNDNPLLEIEGQYTTKVPVKDMKELIQQMLRKMKCSFS